MLHVLRKMTPEPLKLLYHRIVAHIANIWYRSPSDKLIVIGITGTSGKSTTTYLAAKMLEAAGFKVGVASTILFKVDKKEWINNKKMTMVGRFQLQKLISQMAKANCQYALIETTSEGIKQSRHIGINYDVAVFTNLYPEHLEAHGGFENYKKAKLKLFQRLAIVQHKHLEGVKVPKTIIANLDDENVEAFITQKADQYYGFTMNSNVSSQSAQVIRGQNISLNPTFTDFSIEHTAFRINLLGEHNVGNALAAVCIGRSQGLSLQKIADCLQQAPGIPGRIEFIDEGQPCTVIVDYAFEPRAMTKLYEVVERIPHGRIIHVLGGTGGGRDKARRPIIGSIAGQRADVVIVTNEDPYDEDPRDIMDQVAAGAQEAGKHLDTDLFIVEDRRQAIRFAVETAQETDLILITGKGSEQAIVTKNNKKIPWDDRQVVREELARRY